MTLVIRKGLAALAAALLLPATLLLAPTAQAHSWSQLQSYAWQGGNFACLAVKQIGPYWGAAPHAEWSMWRITDGVYTREERFIILALGAAQKCPEHLWIFTAQVPPHIAQNIAVNPPTPVHP